jgi:HSP20 family protein
MFNLLPRRKEEKEVRALTPWGRHPMEWLRREFAPLFERAFAGFPIPFETPFETPWGFETEDTGKEIVIRAELPGFEPTDIDVRLTGNLLTIMAEHKVEAKEKKKEKDGEEIVERHWGKVERTVTLPDGTDMEHIEARYRNGVLEVHLPRLPEALPRHVQVKT